ncbi:similar to Saccharomyces cerevisiae YGL219C MDM34 Mitochondrial component of the ERMES complex [Maudiozyma barnettii]|uniref:Similar to Saccharomyces cerevisiae YGL219C MDM34 Mitochondrial component of the ERMES complex n=1 Tax=Maudiozyma barnettii TaxID=61262 RepID=A0A8H2ZE57_9SACH|nr:ERMES complex subunit MDM34 [Kazachstania barnettii]CAB4251981.1 similar to Saccharomyces cerevisiae YGL219C MDM34 Mitochondrial component of the ERMES complex [Kazachstania barnettii]CAD1778381.1 similar to Saccharomyces cerevisiae YGL219C MDM34 Mitochondrial component of the ERMES complex [Kazachstania barnettii]
MSFKFNEDVFRDNSFNEKIKEKLTSALNKGFHSDSNTNSNSNPNSNKIDLNQYDFNDTNKHTEKADILKSKIIVKSTDFPTIPKFEILDLDINTQPRSLVKGICKIIVKDAMVQLQTVIESNLLLVNMKNSPMFIKPKLIENNSLEIPIVMTFSQISLEAISNIFVKNNSLSISFNDVNLDFNFDCSIKILQNTIERRLKDSMHLLFKDVLPTVLFNMSQSWFTNNHNNSTSNNVNHIPPQLSSSTTSSGTILDKSNVKKNGKSSLPKTVFDEVDLQELSPKNMVRLSTIVSSRHTLSLHGTSGLHSMASIPGCLEKQNLYRFISRMPSLSNYYSAYRTGVTSDNNNVNNANNQMNCIDSQHYSHDNNFLPERVLREKKYDLNQIIDIQNKLYERSAADENEKPKRRTIKLNRKHKKRQENIESVRQSTPTFEKFNLPKLTDESKKSTVTVNNNKIDDEVPSPRTNVPPHMIFNENIEYFTEKDHSLLFDTPLHTNEITDPEKLPNDIIRSIDIKDIKINPKKRINSLGSGSKRISFVGINNLYNNNGWKWGNEDNTTVLPPPPYRL